MSELIKHELSNVIWREYEFGDTVYRINNPVALYTHSNGTTHRILDAEGIVHIVPAPGINGCIVRYKKKEGVEPVRF
jgi:hypothetical protein